jgi:hypothetical protein
MPKNAFHVLSTETLFVLYDRLRERAFEHMRQERPEECVKALSQARSIWETLVSREVAA